MILNMVFDIGNVLMDFRWKEYMRSLFGGNEALIQTINQGIWHNGCWAAMDKGEMDGAATLRNFPIIPRFLLRPIRTFWTLFPTWTAACFRLR